MRKAQLWYFANNFGVPGTGGAVGDHSSCWVTGPFGEDEGDYWRAGGGSPLDEFVIDRRDLGDDAVFDRGFTPPELEGDHKLLNDHPSLSPYLALEARYDAEEEGVTEADLLAAWEATEVYRHYTLYDTLPELVEYGMALDVFVTGPHPDWGIRDRRVKRLAELLVGRDHTLVANEEPRLLLPWTGGSPLQSYRERRSVAIPYEDGLDAFSVGWADPSSPEGGSRADTVAMAQDNVANWVEQMEGTTTHAGGGGVVHFGTTEGIGHQVLFQANEDCGNQGVCDGEINWSSNPVPLVLHTNIREQNDGQFEENVTGPGERTMVIMEGTQDADGNPVFIQDEAAVNLERVLPSSTGMRNPAGSGYDRQFQADTPADELRVSLVLNNKYRKDLENYDPDRSNKSYDPRGLPAMGFNPWTYDRMEGTIRRDPEVNEWPGEAVVPLSNVVHDGYGQPTLSRPYGYALDSGVNDGALTRKSAEHIRWPVNFEDINWYFYKLPTTGYRDPLWLYWVTPRGTTFLVNSAYGASPVPFGLDGSISDPAVVPHCSLPAEEGYYGGAAERVPLNINAVSCENAEEEWDEDAAAAGNHPGVHFPFDYAGTDDTLTLNRNMLVKQGVESAEDVSAPLGTRRLSRFDFSIIEGQPMGDTPPGQKGYEAERRYGIPRAADKREVYLSAWKSESVNPNMPHLLVVTYYEARAEHMVGFNYCPKLPGSLDPAGSVRKEMCESSGVLDLPRREIRRVVCRVMVYPSGFDPPTGELKTIVDIVKERFTSFATKWMGQLMSVVSEVLVSVSEFPLHAGAKTSELACVGMAKVDDLTSLGNVSGPAPPSVVDRGGRLRINAATESRQDGKRRCDRIASPPATTCERSADFIFQGECTRLPEFRIKVRSAEFVDPADFEDPLDRYPDGIPFDEYRLVVPEDAYYQDHGEQDFVQVERTVPPHYGRPVFESVADPSTDPDVELTNYNRGLTRVFMDWDYRWDGVSPDLYDRISGFTVYLYPDQKSVPFESPEHGRAFDLPKWVVTSFRNSDGVTEIARKAVGGFSVGGLSFYPGDDRLHPRSRSDSLVTIDPEGELAVRVPVGTDDMKSIYNSFNTFIHNMPVAPGFTHGFRVAAYVGTPGDPSFRQGPLSETV